MSTRKNSWQTLLTVLNWCNMEYQLTKTLLKLDGISLKFGDNLVLRDINIELKDIVRQSTTGQVVTVLGRSGVGKSQLFKLIAGVQKPTTGSILVGVDQHPVSPGEVGMVLQNYPLFAHHTVQANLELVSRDKEKIDYYLHEFDVYDRKKHYPRQLSGGQRQRVAIIQQLLCSNNFILLDEPFSGLDPVATEKLCQNISKVANLDEYNTVLISSHILEPALAISDQVWMLGYETREEFVSAEQVTKFHKVPGATIRYFLDLAANGLAWREDIRKDPRFTEMVENIRGIFQTI